MEASILSGVQICNLEGGNNGEYYCIEGNFEDCRISIYDLLEDGFFNPMTVPFWIGEPWAAGMTIGPLFSFALRKTVILTEPNGAEVRRLIRQFMDSDGLRLPTVLELVIAQIAYFRARGDYLFPGKYLRTSSMFQSGIEGLDGKSVFLKCDKFISFGADAPESCSGHIAVALVKDI